MNVKAAKAVDAVTSDGLRVELPGRLLDLAPTERLQGNQDPWFFEPLERASLDLVVVDPPWPFRGYAHSARTPQAHYSVMSLGEIERLSVRDLLRPGGYAFVWATWPHLANAMRTLDACGLTYKNRWCVGEAHPKWAPAVGHRIHPVISLRAFPHRHQWPRRRTARSR